MDLESARFLMEPISFEEGQMLIKNPMAFYFQKGIPYEIDWPSYGLKAVLPYYLERLSEDSEELGFGPWFIKDKHYGGFLIGNAGFSGRPDSEGTIEFGYEILNKYGEREYEEEIIDTLCQWAFYQGAKKIQSRCIMINTSAQKILKRNGFRKVSQERGMMLYEKTMVHAQNYKSSISK